MKTVEARLAGIPSMQLFQAAGTVSGSIERDEIAAAQKKLKTWGVTADEIAAELERRGCFKPKGPPPAERGAPVDSSGGDRG